jgi:predicted DsbA family dithiol-disulfide isomerase
MRVSRADARHRDSPHRVGQLERDGETRCDGWALHHELFKVPTAIDESSILRKAGVAGVDLAAFRACLNEGTRSRIDEDIALAKEVGVTATPSFLIGVLRTDRTVKVLRHESGAVPPAAMAKMLDDALETARSDSK